MIKKFFLRNLFLILALALLLSGTFSLSVSKVSAEEAKKQGSYQYANGDQYIGEVCYSDVLKIYTPCGMVGKIINPKGEVIYDGFFNIYSWMGDPYPKYVDQVHRTITGITVYGKKSRVHMVPLREFAEAIGYSVVDWNEQTQEFTIKKDHTTILYKLNSEVVTINGVEQNDMTTTRLINSKPYIPLDHLLTSELHLHYEYVQTEQSYVIHPYFGFENDFIEVYTIDGKKIVVKNDLKESQKRKDEAFAKLSQAERNDVQPYNDQTTRTIKKRGTF